MDRQDKLDFLAQSIQKAKKIMSEVDNRFGTDTPGVKAQPSRQVYTEEDSDQQFVDNTRYLSEADVVNMGRAPQQMIQAPAYDLYEDNERMPPTQSFMPQPQQPVSSNYQPYKNLNTSKMPKEILESFLKTPTIDPTQPLGMEALVQKVAGKPQQRQQQPQQAAPRRQDPIVEHRQPVTDSKSTMDIQLLEYVIKKTVEETLKQVNEQTNLNENIQIKIGDKTFGGKISSLKSIKK